MDPFYAGWLSILPPVVAIILALITKDVIVSLLLGILSGTLIYTIGVGMNPVVGSVEVALDTLVGSLDVPILIFCGLLGALVYLVTMAGGAKAYGKWAGGKIKSKRSAMLFTSGLGVLIFVDDYFNCLTVGTVMRPVTDKYKVSRAKLAYIIDSTAAPICIIAPVSSWAAAVGSSVRQTGAFESDLAAFVATIPYNLYALLALAMVVLVCVFKLDYGPMRAAENLAETSGELGAVESEVKMPGGNRRTGGVLDMLLPIVTLILLSILGMLYNGGLWGPDPAYHSIMAAFGNCTASTALCWAGFGALVVAFFMFVPRKLMSFAEFMAGFTEGVKSMIPAIMILMFAWTIGGVCNNLLMTADFVRDMVVQTGVSGALLPALIFLIAAFLSFSTGTAWGTFGILIPIIVPLATAMSPGLLVVSLSATLAGAVFGDHCSPISDTTILSSTGANCDHLQHVSTQIIYAVPVAACCFIGYLVAGFTDGNLAATLLTAFGLLIVTVLVLSRVYDKVGGKGAKKPQKADSK